MLENFTLATSTITTADAVTELLLNATHACIPETSTTKYTVIPVIYIIICCIGAVGNGLVLVVVGRHMIGYRTYGKPTSVTNVLVFNLAAADLIFLATLPFYALERIKKGRWIFGVVGCKLLSFQTLINMYGSVFFLVMMSMDRFLAVVFVVRARHLRTFSNACKASIVVWVAALVIATEGLVFRDVEDKVNNCSSEIITTCIWKFPDTTYVTLHLCFRLFLGFLLPVTIIVTCYIYIFVRLRRRATNAEMSLGATILTKKQNRVTKMITAVISAFIICWLPNNVMNFLLLVNAKPYNNEVWSLFGMVLGFSNSCINPILYAFMKSDVRAEIKKVFNDICKYCCGTEIRHVSRPPAENYEEHTSERDVQNTTLQKDFSADKKGCNVEISARETATLTTVAETEFNSIKT